MADQIADAVKGATAGLKKVTIGENAKPKKEKKDKKGVDEGPSRPLEVTTDFLHTCESLWSFPFERILIPCR